jgi:hypothetical protein
MFSQQGCKGHEERDLLSLDLEAFVALLKSLPSPLCFLPLGDLAVRLPVPPNGLVLIECRVQLFNGDVAGYSE